VVAFARVHGEQAAIVVAGRCFRSLTGGEMRLPTAEDWAGTSLVVPPHLERRRGWGDALGLRGRDVDGWDLASIFAAGPWALLVPAERSRRASRA
jgi:(1->4)-alpha-D-glucan 1-alpha-D-glucosylmutase